MKLNIAIKNNRGANDSFFKKINKDLTTVPKSVLHTKQSCEKKEWPFIMDLTTLCTN